MFILSHSVGLLILFFSVVAAPLKADPEPEGTDDGPSLEAILKATISNSGQIKEAEGDIAIARAQLDQARAALFPHGSAMLLAAPIFEDRGDALHSQSNWKHWGPFLAGSAQIIQPLYTFGQISNYRKAAENQIVARTHQAQMKKDEIVMQAKEFYYGFQMATDLGDLVGDLIKFLDEAVTKAEKQQKNKKRKSGVTPHDIFHLRSALSDLRQKKLQADAGKATAEKAVGWISGASFRSLPKERLSPEEFDLKSLEEYLSLAQRYRPEFRALTAGQEARSALRDAKRAQSYPMIFIGAFGNLPWSPVRQKQGSIFANDPYNQPSGGAGLGFKLDIEFNRHTAEAAEQSAELMKLKATESYAAPGVALQVKKAYFELQQAMEGLKIAEERKNDSERWFVSDAMGWSIGITPPKDLLEALEGNGLAKKNYIETVYSLNMALGHLTQAVGKEITSLTYQ